MSHHHDQLRTGHDRSIAKCVVSVRFFETSSMLKALTNQGWSTGMRFERIHPQEPNASNWVQEAEF
jgi:hypothetical protein